QGGGDVAGGRGGDDRTRHLPRRVGGRPHRGRCRARGGGAAHPDRVPARADGARLSARFTHETTAMIDLRYVKKLVDLLDSSTVDSIEISSDKGMKIRISKTPQQRGTVRVASP